VYQQTIVVFNVIQQSKGMAKNSYLLWFQHLKHTAFTGVPGMNV
jgi:hypothetical protein